MSPFFEHSIERHLETTLSLFFLNQKPEDQFFTLFLEKRTSFSDNVLLDELIAIKLINDRRDEQMTFENLFDFSWYDLEAMGTLLTLRKKILNFYKVTIQENTLFYPTSTEVLVNSLQK